MIPPRCHAPAARWRALLFAALSALALHTPLRAAAETQAPAVPTLEPYAANGWNAQAKAPPSTPLAIDETERAGMYALLLRVDALRVRVARRERANALWLARTDASEEPASDGALRFELCWLGRRYAFDRWGHFAIDRRFVDPDDLEVIAHFEAFYRQHLLASALGKRFPPQARPKSAAPAVPVFAGFEEERYQQHDALIAKLVAEFNRDRAAAVGAPEGRAVAMPELSPALVKALMIEESGGNGPRSQEAWRCDPLQVNVPGDWNDAKADLGLTKPTARNEGTLELNLRAGIRYLARKGFGTSGQPLSRRPEGYFDSWRQALQRYNGRSHSLRDGRSFRTAYAERILRRANDPECFVPIARERPAP